MSDTADLVCDFFEECFCNEDGADSCTCCDQPVSGGTEIAPPLCVRLARKAPWCARLDFCQRPLAAQHEGVCYGILVGVLVGGVMTTSALCLAFDSKAALATARWLLVLVPSTFALQMASYAVAMLAHPGKPCVETTAGAASDIPADAFCDKCDAFKPPRVRHCSHCERCVLRFDHACPWVGNCIGFNNHKAFVLFLFYTMVAVVLHAVIIMRFLIHLSSGALRVRSAGLIAAMGILIPLAIVVLLGSGVFCTIMFGWNMYLLLRNQTTIENLRLSNPIKYRNEPSYDLGPVRNVRAFCGPTWLDLLLILVPIRASGQHDYLALRAE